MAKRIKKEFIYAVGRRKEASARVRLFENRGENLVNAVPAERYFPGEVNKVYLELPFKLTGTLGKLSFSARIVGGGKKGQLEALVLGIARALVKKDESFKKVLKQHNLLTRDARVRERRKPGTGGKARREKQSPKR